jgi:cation:H+ antiporter
MVFIWILVFIASLALTVKSADWLLEKSEKIGLALGISPFIVGVTIVAAGTSFPELISGFMAVWQGATEIVVANAIGSNIANILLVIGVSAVVARKIVVTKNLIDLDLPLLAISTGLALIVLWDRQVTMAEGIVLLVTYFIYLAYTMIHNESEDAAIKDTGDLPDIIPAVESKAKKKKDNAKKVGGKRPKINGMDLLMLALGIVGLFIGSKLMIDSVIALSALFNINPGLIAITAVALGTSLPELLVSVKAAMQGKAEIAIGNIFGSNVFNLLVVIGFPAIFKTLQVDDKTFLIGIPVVVIATLVFTISGISRRIHIWEGLMYLILYLLFIVKLFGIF